jgi:hypothetical protein
VLDRAAKNLDCGAGDDDRGAELVGPFGLGAAPSDANMASASANRSLTGTVEEVVRERRRRQEELKADCGGEEEDSVGCGPGASSSGFRLKGAQSLKPIMVFDCFRLRIKKDEV